MLRTKNLFISILHMYIGFCDYPTYFDSVSDGCVLTCPAGTIGNVNRTTNVVMRNCTSRELKMM